MLIYIGKEQDAMILIIDRKRKRADTIRDMFYYVGVLSYAVTPREALSEISLSYRAVIISEPDMIPDVTDFIKKIKAYNSSVPIFSLSENERTSAVDEGFDESFCGNIYSSTLLSKIRYYASERNLRVPGSYALMGIDVGCDKSIPMFFDDKIPFTKTEVMILRALISSYPRPMSAKEILKYAFRSNKKPEPSGVRTHISVMNKKFQESFSRPLIFASEGKGYLIKAPELISLCGDN